MGSIMDPPPGAVIDESRAYKEASALDPRGVEYVGQLTLPERPFQVFWEDSIGIHRTAPVGCWWNHYRFGWQTDDLREQSELRFIIPREMVVVMQTRYANEFRARFFGDTAKHQLDQEFLPGERVDMTDGPYSDPEGARGTKEIFPASWHRFRVAFAATVADRGNRLGGQSLQAMIPGVAEFIIRARVVNDEDLVLNIEHLYETFGGYWAAHMRRALRIK